KEYLVGPAFNLLKGTCKSRVELEYNFKECYKAITNQLEWTNPEGHKYPFNISEPLPLIEDQGRQVVLANYFINNDLEYLKSGSLSMKYTTSTTKTRAAKYDTIEGIEDIRDREDKDKDEDPPAGSDQGLKKQKARKDAELSRGELVFEAANTEMPLNQGDDMGNTKDQPNVEVASRDDLFKKPKRPPTLDLDWNTTKTIDFRAPRTWIRKIAKA
nr:hypothetical protein [Tanacetum cinerariifolium]